MVMETLKQPFIPDDTELKTLQTELEEYISAHTNGFTEEYRKKYERFEELQTELEQAEAEYNSAQHDTNRFKTLSKHLKMMC